MLAVMCVGLGELGQARNGAIMKLDKDETNGKSGWKEEVFLGGLVGEKKRRKRRREVGITKTCKAVRPQVRGA